MTNYIFKLSHLEKVITEIRSSESHAHLSEIFLEINIESYQGLPELYISVPTGRGMAHDHHISSCGSDDDFDYWFATCRCGVCPDCVQLDIDYQVALQQFKDEGM